MLCARPKLAERPSINFFLGLTDVRPADRPNTDHKIVCLSYDSKGESWRKCATQHKSVLSAPPPPSPALPFPPIPLTTNTNYKIITSLDNTCATKTFTTARALTILFQDPSEKHSTRCTCRHYKKSLGVVLFLSPVLRMFVWFAGRLSW